MGELTEQPLFDPFTDLVSDEPRGILANLDIGNTINCFTGEIEKSDCQDVTKQNSHSFHKTTYDICSEEDIEKSFGIGITASIPVHPGMPEISVSASFKKLWREHRNYSWFMCRVKVTREVIQRGKPKRISHNATHYVKEVITGGELFFMCSSDLVLFHKETFRNLDVSAGKVKGSIALDRIRGNGDRKDIVKCYSTLGNYLPQNIEDIEDIVEEILDKLDELDVRPVKVTLAPIKPPYLSEDDYKSIGELFRRSSRVFKDMEKLSKTITIEGNYPHGSKVDRIKKLTETQYLTMCSYITNFYETKSLDKIDDLVEKMNKKRDQIYPRGNLLDQAEKEMENFISHETDRLLPQPVGPRGVGKEFSGIRKRVVIIGKTGVGKSSLANYILCEERFKVGETSNRCTVKYQDEETKLHEENLQIIDTPGFFDTDNEKANNVAVREIRRAQRDADEGFHAFIFLANAKGPSDTIKVYNKIRAKYRGIKNYLIVVFNRVENSVDDAMYSQEFSTICRDVGSRYLGVRSKDFRYVPSAERDRTLTALLHLINVCVHINKGKVYKPSKNCKMM